MNFKLPDFPQGYILRTPHLLLRPPSVDDLSELYSLVSDSRLTEFLAWEPHSSEGSTLEMISLLIEQQKAGKSFHWLVINKDSIIGLVSLIDVRRTHRSWTLNRGEVAYWITPKAQGNGYAEEATRAMVQFGFDHLSLHKIIVYHAADNPPSGRVVQKLGFRYVGTELEAFCKSGIWHDLCHYEILNSEFKKFNK
jgi:RimJ/RimL family protein N-acetyltransferase